MLHREYAQFCLYLADTMTFELVNAHYLNHVVTAAHTHRVEVAEDIYNDKGIKLIAKGAIVDENLHGKLIRHKLRRPLDASLTLFDGASAQSLHNALLLLLDDEPRFAEWLGEAARTCMQADIRTITLPEAGWLALTTGEMAPRDLLAHGLRVAVLAYGLAYELRCSEEIRKNCITAGLLHDVGMLYIDPNCLRPETPLTPSDWKQLAAHPLIGAMWLKELNICNADVSRAVLEHHERADGSGYPKQLLQEESSILGKILSAAEFCSGIFEQAHFAEGRLKLILQCVPHGFSPILRDAMFRCMKRWPSHATPNASLIDTTPALHGMILRIAQAMDVLYDIEKQLPATSKAHVILAQLTARLNQIQRSFSSTGVDAWLQHQGTTPAEEQQTIQQELMWIIQETNWQTRHLARDISRLTLSLSADESLLFSPLEMLFIALPATPI